MRDAEVVIELARYREGPSSVVEILRARGAEVTDRHRELAATAGAPQVEAVLRR